MIDFHPLTIDYSQIVHELSTTVHICDPEKLEKIGPDQAFIPFKGIWDTGASASVISRKVINDLGLKSVNEVEIQTANGTRKSEVHLISMGLPNGVFLPSIAVADGRYDWSRCFNWYGCNL